MTGNITFTADEASIDEARALAREESTALNEQFRLRLEACTRKRRAARAKECPNGSVNTHRRAGASSREAR